MSIESELDLTQRWLALTHEAIWLYGLIGARIPAFAEAATDQITFHEGTRDRLSDRVRSLGGKPVSTEPSYDVPAPQQPTQGQSLAQEVESRIAATCVRLVAVTTEHARDLAVRGLHTAALTQLRWGGAPEPFPGLD